MTLEMINLTYPAQSKGRFRSQTQCYNCKEFGHITKHYNKKFTIIAKKKGHVIKDCRVQPQNRHTLVFYNVFQFNFTAASLVPSLNQ